MISQHIHAEGYENVEMLDADDFIAVYIQQGYGTATARGDAHTIGGSRLCFIVKGGNLQLYRRLAGALEDAANQIESRSATQVTEPPPEERVA